MILRRSPTAFFWICLLALFSYWVWTPLLNDFGGDSAEYLLIAQHWSFFGEPNMASAQFAAATNYPPFYPLLLALFSGGQSWLIAHQITAFCGIAALFVLWRNFLVEDYPPVSSLIFVGIVALIPGVYSQALYIHSEFLFLLFVSLCLFAVSRLERETKLRFVVVASLAAAGAYLTRSIGISLVAALVIYFGLHRPKREWTIVFGFAVVPVLVWTLFRQTHSGGYLGVWEERLAMANAPDIVDVVMSKGRALLDGYVVNFAGAGSSNTAALMLFSIVCFAAWLVRLAQGKLDALFIGAYLVILLVWPFPAERVRFIMPVVPILVMQVLLYLHGLRLNRHKRSAILVSRAIVLMLLITILPSLVLTAQRHFESMPIEFEDYRRSPEWYAAANRNDRLSTILRVQRFTVGFEEIRKHVPKHECVYSIKPSLVGLYGQRTSYRSPLPNSKLGLQLDPLAVACRYVSTVAFASPSYLEGHYPIGRWANGVDLVHVTRMIESDAASDVIAILAKVR
ncbi:MAG: glycosyltransferase family 39 protein [Burkholderiales bacterium]|nr:glycosyltransferase family 39 protein [Burkholderiales bacterium]